MDQTNVAIAETFYAAMGEKNIEAMERYLRPDVELVTPLTKLQGKEAYLEAVKSFTSFFNTLTIRAKFSDGNQVLIVYDVDCPFPIGKIPSAALMTFQEGIIAKNELFHDTSPFNKVKDELLA